MQEVFNLFLFFNLLYTSLSLFSCLSETVGGHNCNSRVGSLRYVTLSGLIGVLSSADFPENLSGQNQDRLASMLEDVEGSKRLVVVD